MDADNKKQYNYFKLLENIKQCYADEISRLEIPFSCANDYPIDMCYRLQKLNLNLDFTDDSILIQFPTKNSLTIDS